MNGARTAIKALDEDVKLEREAARIYTDWASRFEEEEGKQFFERLSLDEAGHAAGQSALLRSKREGKYDVKSFCPRCGWIISLGIEPRLGTGNTCPMCGVRTVLKEDGGDYVLEKSM